MSGSVANRWAMSPEKHHLERAFQIAKELGKPQNSYEELVAFLKTESSDTLNQFSSIEVVSYALFIVIFGPVVESMLSNQESPHDTMNLNAYFEFYRKRCKTAVFS